MVLMVSASSTFKSCCCCRDDYRKTTPNIILRLQQSQEIMIDQPRYSVVNVSAASLKVTSFSHEYDCQVDVQLSLYRNAEHPLRMFYDIAQVCERLEEILRTKFTAKLVNVVSLGGKPISHRYDGTNNYYSTNYCATREFEIVVKPNVHVYVHEPHCVQISCQSMNSRNSSDPNDCPIYRGLLNQMNQSRESFKHLDSCTHFKDELREKPICRHKDGCHSFKRVEQGGNDIVDACHMKLYRHPPRSRRSDIAKNARCLVLHESESHLNLVLHETESHLRAVQPLCVSMSDLQRSQSQWLRV